MRTSFSGTRCGIARHGDAVGKFFADGGDGLRDRLRQCARRTGRYRRAIGRNRAVAVVIRCGDRRATGAVALIAARCHRARSSRSRSGCSGRRCGSPPRSSAPGRSVPALRPAECPDCRRCCPRPRQAARPARRSARDETGDVDAVDLLRSACSRRRRSARAAAFRRCWCRAQSRCRDWES